MFLLIIIMSGVFANTIKFLDAQVTNAIPQCPSSVFCSTNKFMDEQNCNNYCGPLLKASVPKVPCKDTMLPYQCVCEQTGKTPTGCYIPTSDTCLFPATSSSRCASQCQGYNFQFSITGNIAECKCLGCEPLTTTQIVPTPKPVPTPRPMTNMPSTTKNMVSFLIFNLFIA